MSRWAAMVAASDVFAAIDDWLPRSATGMDLGAGAAVQAVLAVLVLCILIAGSVYLLSSFRDYAAEDRLERESLGSNFQEMLRRGDITEAEYRMIQSKSNGDSVVAASDRAAPKGGQAGNQGDASRKDG